MGLGIDDQFPVVVKFVAVVDDHIVAPVVLPQEGRLQGPNLLHGAQKVLPEVVIRFFHGRQGAGGPVDDRAQLLLVPDNDAALRQMENGKPGDQIALRRLVHDDAVNFVRALQHIAEIVNKGVRRGQYHRIERPDCLLAASIQVPFLALHHLRRLPPFGICVKRPQKLRQRLCGDVDITAVVQLGQLALLLPEPGTLQFRGQLLNLTLQVNGFQPELQQ